MHRHRGICATTRSVSSPMAALSTPVNISADAAHCGDAIMTNTQTSSPAPTLARRRDEARMSEARGATGASFCSSSSFCHLPRGDNFGEYFKMQLSTTIL